MWKLTLQVSNPLVKFGVMVMNHDHNLNKDDHDHQPGSPMDSFSGKLYPGNRMEVINYMEEVMSNNIKITTINIHWVYYD